MWSGKASESQLLILRAGEQAWLQVECRQGGQATGISEGGISPTFRSHRYVKSSGSQLPCSLTLVLIAFCGLSGAAVT